MIERKELFGPDILPDYSTGRGIRGWIQGVIKEATGRLPGVLIMLFT
jgi:hypothetical protein